MSSTVKILNYLGKDFVIRGRGSFHGLDSCPYTVVTTMKFDGEKHMARLFLPLPETLLHPEAFCSCGRSSCPIRTSVAVTLVYNDLADLRDADRKRRG